ncbi:MAG: hypothetical protein L0Z50_40700 [Verrucomicrobiales bacterium]|nr:hypothetical protein [Verrucomicrobiales bacterium]
MNKGGQIVKHPDEGDLISRKTLLKRGGALLGGAVLLGIAAKRPVEAAQGRTLTFDIACDGRTLRVIPTLRPEGPQRGDAFIINGKVFPGGTNPPSPDQAGSIADWICYGTIYGDIFSCETPHAYVTETLEFYDGDVINDTGPTGGEGIVRIVLGGQGRFVGIEGTVAETVLGTNDTCLQLSPDVCAPAPVYRMVFHLIH